MNGTTVNDIRIIEIRFDRHERLQSARRLAVSAIQRIEPGLGLSAEPIGFGGVGTG